MVDATIGLGWKIGRDTTNRFGRSIHALHLENAPSSWLAYFANVDLRPVNDRARVQRASETHDERSGQTFAPLHLGKGGAKGEGA